MNGNYKKTILLVEDELDIAMEISQKIKNFDYNVITANTGENALNIITENNNIDLILMDIILDSDIDGAETAKKILSIKKIPIIFLICQMSEDCIDKVSNIARYGYLIKDSADPIIKNSIDMALELFHEQNKTIVSNTIFQSLVDSMPQCIFSKDLNGIFVYANKSYCKMEGKKIEDILGKTDYELHPIELAKKYIKDDKYVIETKKLIEMEEQHQPQNGNKSYVKVIKAPVFGSANNISGVLGIFWDITEQKNSEIKMQTLLQEKEALLKEVHHRIKSNLNIIKNLLSIQYRKLINNETSKALKDAIGRIDSMGILYDKLYKSGDYQNISTKDYFCYLIEEVYKIFPQTSSIKINTKIDDIVIKLDFAFPIGIIINELLINAIKYAFIDVEDGLIEISLYRKDNNSIILIFSDNGIGLPESEAIEKQNGFGLSLVSLLTHQINADYEIDRTKGTKFTFEFNI